MLSSKLILALSIGFFSLTNYASYENYVRLSEQIEKQQEANDSLEKWRALYVSMLPVKEQWNSIFPNSSDAMDIYALWQKTGIDPIYVNPDDIRIKSIDSIIFNDTPLSLNRICFSGKQNSGIIIKNKNPVELFKTIENIANKESVVVGDVKFSEDKGYGKVEISNFCLLARKEVVK